MTFFVTSVGPGNPAWGNSNYHSFQTRFEQRFGGGATMGVAYTWSKSISDSSDGIWNDGQGTLRNWYCRSCERSLTSYDVPHRLVVNYNYELPFGKGKRLFTDDDVFGRVLGGWSLSALTTINGGTLRGTVAGAFGTGGGLNMSATGAELESAVRSSPPACTTSRSSGEGPLNAMLCSTFLVDSL